MEFSSESNTDSESSNNDDNESTNLDEHLKPYNYEPLCRPRKDLLRKSEGSNSDNYSEESDASFDSKMDHRRKGNTN